MLVVRCTKIITPVRWAVICLRFVVRGISVVMLPFLKKNKKTLIRNVMRTGMEVADDVLEGQSLKSSVKKRLPQGIKRTAGDMDWQTGSGFRKKRKTRDALSYRRMAFVHEQSCECTKSELDLFSAPPTQTSVGLRDAAAVTSATVGGCREVNSAV